MRSRIHDDQVEDKEFLSPYEHKGLHDRDTYVELVRGPNNKVTTINMWVNNSKSKMISSTNILREEGVITSVKYIYDYINGTDIVATISGSITKPYRKVTSMTNTRDKDLEGI